MAFIYRVRPSTRRPTLGELLEPDDDGLEVIEAAREKTAELFDRLRKK